MGRDSKCIFSGTVLQGKGALITGGGTGIGRDIGLYYGKHGAKVAVMGRRKHVLEEAAVFMRSQVLEIDTIGAYTMCHAALHYLKKGGIGKQPLELGGSIINMTVTVQHAALWYQLHLCAAKNLEVLPLGQMGEKVGPYDGCNLLDLTSDAAKYVTGGTLNVDGGLWVGEPRRVDNETIRNLSREYEQIRTAALKSKL